MTLSSAHRPLIILLDPGDTLPADWLIHLDHGTWRFVSCSSLEEAHDLACTERPVALVSTARLPEVRRGRWSRALRSSLLPELSQVPFLVIVPTDLTDDPEEFRQHCGATALLTTGPHAPAPQLQLQTLLHPQPSLTTRRVLGLVTPAPDLENLATLLASSGHTFTIESDPTCAAARLAAADYDLVIADLDLHPEPSAAYTLLAARSPTSALIVLTARDDPSLPLQSVHAGAHTHLRRPWAPAYLHHLCTAAIADHARDRREDHYARRVLELRRSQRRLTRLLEAPGTIDLLLDPTGRIIVANPAAHAASLELFGTTLALGQPAAEFVPPSFAARLRRDIAVAHRQSTHRRVLHLLDRRNTPRWFDLTLSAVRGIAGDVEFVALHAAALTADRRTLAELQLRDDALAAISQGVVITDADRRILYANAHFHTITGYPPADTIGRNCKFLQGPATDPVAIEALRASMVAGRPVCTTLLNYRPDGSLFWNELNIQPIHDARGRLTHFIGIQNDVTARHEAELALRASQQRLQAIFDNSGDAILLYDDQAHCLAANPAAAQLTGYDAEELCQLDLRALTPEERLSGFDERFQSFLTTGRVRAETTIRHRDGSIRIIEYHAIARIQPGVHLIILRDVSERRTFEAQLARHQRLESVGRLASGVAHDLNNILTPILMVPGMLLKLVPDPEARSLIKAIETGARRGSSVVRQLMSFAQALPGEKLPIDLATIISDCLSVVRETFPREITCDWTPPSTPCPVSGDLDLLKQVLLSLVINSRDAMPSGGRLALSLREVVLTPENLPTLPPEARPGLHYELVVTDTGSGIAPENLDKVFDPFFTTKPFGEGSGLGLSTALGIVRDHHGFIQITSRLGRGTAVKLYFPPLAKPATELSPETAPSPAFATPVAADAAPPPPPTILVVDDEDGLRDTLRFLLEEAGYQVLGAESSDAAFAQLRGASGKVDLIITDLSMPGISGDRHLERLQRQYATIPVIVMSGLDHTKILPPPVRAHAADFLPKPFTGEQILQSVERLIPAPHRP